MFSFIEYEILEPLIKGNNGRKRKRKYSIYKEQKSSAHTTINGSGIIGRLFKKIT